VLLTLPSTALLKGGGTKVSKGKEEGKSTPPSRENKRDGELYVLLPAKNVASDEGKKKPHASWKKSKISTELKKEKEEKCGGTAFVPRNNNTLDA